MLTKRLNLKLAYASYNAMLLSNPDDIVFIDDLGLVQENKLCTHLCSDWWSSKQGLVCRSSN